jgi:hypothetical protein
MFTLTPIAFHKVKELGSGVLFPPAAPSPIPSAFSGSSQNENKNKCTSCIQPQSPVSKRHVRSLINWRDTDARYLRDTAKKRVDLNTMVGICKYYYLFINIVFNRGGGEGLTLEVFRGVLHVLLLAILLP